MHLSFNIASPRPDTPEATERIRNFEGDMAFYLQARCPAGLWTVMCQTQAPDHYTFEIVWRLKYAESRSHLYVRNLRLDKDDKIAMAKQVVQGMFVFARDHQFRLSWGEAATIFRRGIDETV